MGQIQNSGSDGYTDLYPGVTVHYIDKGEDTGDIIFQDRLYVSLIKVARAA